MRRKPVDQRDFAEQFLPEDVGRDDVLERVDGLVDWTALEAVCEEIYAAPVGRPSYPLRTPIKALLVQAWWNLSDPKAEQALRNDLRFHRFLGVGLPGPDRNTLWRFREELAKRGHAERLLAAVDRQFRARGLVCGAGASWMRRWSGARHRRRAGRRDGTAVDRDADWTARDGRDPTLGYELHAAVDEDTGIVRKVALTPASRHERTVAEAVVPGDVGRLWADAAYDAGALREGLEARGITPVIAHNPRRRGLARWQRGTNFVVRTVRPRIEPVFGTVKRSYGLARARGFTLARNLVDADHEGAGLEPAPRHHPLPARDLTPPGVGVRPFPGKRENGSKKRTKPERKSSATVTAAASGLAPMPTDPEPGRHHHGRIKGRPQPRHSVSGRAVSGHGDGAGIRRTRAAFEGEECISGRSGCSISIGDMRSFHGAGIRS